MHDIQFIFIGIILLFFFVWSSVIYVSVCWLYIKSTFLFLINIKGDRLEKKINKEKYESFFNAPLMIYPFNLFISAFGFELFRDNIIKYINKPFYEFLYYKESDIMYFVPIFSLIMLYFGIILFYTFYFEKNSKENIINTFKRHQKFLKILFIPTALIGIIVPIVSVGNIIFSEDMKTEILMELSNFNISTTVEAFSSVLLYTLVNAAIGYFILVILIHVVEEIAYYSYFVKIINRILRKIN